MAIETEIKLKVDSFNDIIQKLNKAGAKFENDYWQIDRYFDDSEDSLVESDRCLRLRIEHDGGPDVISLTYKGARENHRFKSRREIGIKVEKAEEMTHIFEALGYKQKLVFEKRRAMWLLDGCFVTLDELPMLGKFVEVEGPDDEIIEAVCKKLGLGGLVHIEHSYAHLIEEKLCQAGKKDREVFF